MSTGITIKKIKTEIQSIISDKIDVHAVYGFGSFFRSEDSQDIDILFVVRASCNEPLKVFYEIQKSLLVLEKSLGIKFDLLVLTEEEFRERPLRDMDSIVKL
jgi:predicted nucleotidyltransferase